MGSRDVGNYESTFWRKDAALRLYVSKIDCPKEMKVARFYRVMSQSFGFAIFKKDIACRNLLREINKLWILKKF